LRDFKGGLEEFVDKVEVGGEGGEGSSSSGGGGSSTRPLWEHLKQDVVLLMGAT